MTGGDDLSQTQRIQAAVGGEANIIASSVLYEASNTSSTGCDTVSYLCNGMPLTATQEGLLNFNSSVALPLNAEFAFPGDDSYSEFSSGNLIADPFSYVAATPTQNGNTVQVLFDNGDILTEGDTYDLIGDPELTFFNPLPNGAVPLADGVLVSVIPDATPGGANQLINPIDDSPITTDVFGNPRTNDLGFRDIGAVQVQGELGDMNCDGAVDLLDVDPFILAISDPAGYGAAYPDCDINQADCNQDGVVNLLDVDPFIAILGGG